MLADPSTDVIIKAAAQVGSAATAATIAAIGAVVAAILAWGGTLIAAWRASAAQKAKGGIDAELSAQKGQIDQHVESRKTEFAGLLETHKGQLAVEVAKLVEPMKGEIAQELARQEATLRVYSETRLRLFERSVRSVEAVLRLAHLDADTTGNLFIYLHGRAVSERTGEFLPPLDLNRFPAVRLERHGAFLPPALDDAYDSLCGVLSRSKQLAGRVLTGQESYDAHAGTAATNAAEAEVIAFQSAARNWKRCHWERIAPGISATLRAHQPQPEIPNVLPDPGAKRDRG